MSYLITKENITGEKDVFIPSSVLAEKFNRKLNHVDAKLKAIMYITEDPDVFDLPLRKMLSDGKVIYLELNDYGKIDVYSNKELVNFAIKDWKNKSNTNIISEINNEFDKVMNSLTILEEIPQEEYTNSVQEEYYAEVEVYENIENPIEEDTIEEEPINIDMAEVSGKYLLTASELYMALKLGDLYDFEEWVRNKLVNNPMYVEGIDYEECETYNPESEPHFFTDYIIDSIVARELISVTDSSESIRVRNYIASFSEIPKVNNEDNTDFIDNLKLNIYYIERYLPSVLNWKTAEDIMPKLLDRCMEEINSGNIKVEVFSAVIRTALKIVDKEQDSTKKELLNKQITEWMIKRAQIYAGIISSVKTENAKLKSQLSAI